MTLLSIWVLICSSIIFWKNYTFPLNWIYPFDKNPFFSSVYICVCVYVYIHTHTHTCQFLDSVPFHWSLCLSPISVVSTESILSLGNIWQSLETTLVVKTRPYHWFLVDRCKWEMLLSFIQCIGQIPQQKYWPKMWIVLRLKISLVYFDIQYHTVLITLPS